MPLTLSRRAILALGAALLPLPALAAPDVIAAPVREVTLYPAGAQVRREAVLPEGGAREVLIPGLPEGTDLAGLRVGGAGIEIGAVRLLEDRLPGPEAPERPEVAAARAELERRAAALAEGEAGVGAIRARAEAARARIAFLKGLGAGAANADIAALARDVGAELLAAATEAEAAEAEARRADLALAPARKDLKAAEAALAALARPGRKEDALLLTVSGGGTLTITTQTEAAGWAPAYDLRYDRAAGRLSLERLVSVRQSSGEDWLGAELVFSTARPGGQSAASELWPWLLRFGEEAPPMPLAKGRMLEESLAADSAAGMAAAAPVVAEAGLEMQGLTATYRFPAPVDLRDGADGLRLRLARTDLPATLLAEAVPMVDATAFRVVEAETVGAEPLLPGPAVLWLDGAVVGTAELPFVAAGDELRVGFGPIDGLKLKRLVPEANEGDRGVISKANERRERAELVLENLTPEMWPVRLLDRVPYAEQEDLVITHSATPAPVAQDYDDRRGVLEWRFDLAPKETKTVTLETVIRWPAGKVLQ